MSKLRVGVLRGGPSSEYEISLKSGENILRELSPDKYIVSDILLTKDGIWHKDGAPFSLAEIAEQVDLVVNALHGSYGEDGKVQRDLDMLGIPHTGSSALSSAIGMHKMLSKERFAEAGLMVPRGAIVERGTAPADAALEIFRAMMFPLIVKPVSGGSSVATAIAISFDALRGAIGAAQEYGDVLIEELVGGKEATVCVIDSSQGESFALFPIEIIPSESRAFFSYDAKYSGASQEICPGRFPLSIHSELRKMAIRAHTAIGARHYSRSDFIISPKGIYILEINTLPGMTRESLFPKALNASGITMSEFLDHLIKLALLD